MKYISFLLLLCLLTGCDHKYSTQKLGINDPFKTTMVPSEFFAVKADQDNVVEGSNGTTIALPKGCFKDKNGNIVTGDVKIELAEALSLSKMLASNLTTTADGMQLRTDGMIYFKATTNGEELSVNKDKPVYIEIPSKNKRSGMQIYRGVRDDKGNMNWFGPKQEPVFLTEADISTLDFLPENFAAMVSQSMPLGGHKEATKAFIDSMYYSFSTVGDPAVAQGAAQSGTEAEKRVKEQPGLLNEPHYNPNKKIENGAYTKESYDYSNKSKQNALLKSDTTISEAAPRPHEEIDPARIKALKDPHFAHTLIATHEFEKRLKYIFKTCNKDILEIYVKNLDKNMWELDQMAADKLGDDPLAKRFAKFAAQKLTNVKDAPEQASLMQDYYEKQLAKNKEQLKAAWDKMVGLQKAEQKTADSMRDAYTDLLWKREKYRMERYKFTWTDNGWINVDTGWVPKKRSTYKLEATLDNNVKFDRVHTYVIFEDIKSLYKLNTESNTFHYAGSPTDHKMDMEPDKKALLITVAYKDTTAWLNVKGFTTGRDASYHVSVARSSQQEIDHTINEIEKGTYNPEKPKEKLEEGAISVSKKSDYAEENSIAVDLSFQTFFYKDEKRQEQLLREQRTLEHLYALVYPCRCAGKEIAEGRNLFRSNCASCHDISRPETGPQLAGVTYRHSREWLYSFTRNWSDLVAAGDKDAINIVNYSPSEMNRYPSLRDDDMKKLYDYIECEGGYAASAGVSQ